jgi:hypothetical protein
VAAALRAAHIEIVTSLPDNALARTVGNTILIDGSAAGWGWWTDVNAAPAANRMDLLTVVAHEFGHVLGLENGVLAQATLDPGVRRGPTSVLSVAQLAAEPSTSTTTASTVSTVSTAPAETAVATVSQTDTNARVDAHPALVPTTPAALRTSNDAPASVRGAAVGPMGTPAVHADVATGAPAVDTRGAADSVSISAAAVRQSVTTAVGDARATAPHSIDWSNGVADLGALPWMQASQRSSLGMSMPAFGDPNVGQDLIDWTAAVPAPAAAGVTSAEPAHVRKAAPGEIDGLVLASGMTLAWAIEAPADVDADSEE